MSHPLTDLVRHNSWANHQMLQFLKEQPATVLELDIAPGGYSNVLKTLAHTIGSEASYLIRLTGIWNEIPFDREAPLTLELVSEWLAVVETGWNRFLASEFDGDAPAQARGDGKVFHVTHGIVFTQAMHHGSEHRAQICDILGWHGIEPPDVSSWQYGEATGRSYEIES